MLFATGKNEDGLPMDFGGLWKRRDKRLDRKTAVAEVIKVVLKYIHKCVDCVGDACMNEASFVKQHGYSDRNDVSEEVSWMCRW